MLFLGIVIPVLPGDSLLLICGAAAAATNGQLNPWLFTPLMVAATLTGDNVTYFIGCRLGRKLFHRENSKFFNKRFLEKTHAFYEKYGGRTIIIGRFIPGIRTFAPLVAGMGKMNYRHFMIYSTVAAIVWVQFFFWIGYIVGNRFEDNLPSVLIGILVVSAIPAVVEFIRHYRNAKQERRERLLEEAEKPVEVAAKLS